MTYVLKEVEVLPLLDVALARGCQQMDHHD
jgi:hypothetical protein